MPQFHSAEIPEVGTEAPARLRRLGDGLDGLTGASRNQSLGEIIQQRFTESTVFG